MIHLACADMDLVIEQLVQVWDILYTSVGMKTAHIDSDKIPRYKISSVECDELDVLDQSVTQIITPSMYQISHTHLAIDHWNG